MKAPAAITIIVTSPDFFRAEEKLIQQHPAAITGKAYLRWQVMHGAPLT